MDTSPDDDRPLFDLDALRRRDPQAVENWFRAHADTVYALALRRVGIDRATDVVQETFLAALRRIGDYDPGRGAMVAWLLVMTRNPIRAALREASRHTSLSGFRNSDEVGDFDGLAMLDQAPLPDELLERRQTAELVQAALSSLSERHRRALLGHYTEERSLREMAAVEGLSESATKSMLHRARGMFRRALEACSRAWEDAASSARSEK